MSNSSSSGNSSSSHDGSSNKSPPSSSSGSKSSPSPPPPPDSTSKSPSPDSDGSGSSSPSPPKSPPPDGSSSNNSPSPPKSGSSSPPPPSNNDAPPPSSSTAAVSSSSSSSSPPPPSSQSSPPSSSSSPPPPSSSSSSPPPPPSSSSSSSSLPSSSSLSSGHPPPPKNDKHSPSPPNSSARESPPTLPLNPETTTNSFTRSKQTPSTHPDNTPSSGSSRITPPSTHGDSSSSTPSSSRNSSGSNHNTAGLAVGLAVAGVAVILIAFIIIVSRKKKRKRVDGLATYYMPPNSYSGRSDGYYYRQENPMRNASHSSSYYASQPPIPHASGIMNGGSQRGQVYHSGQMEPVGLKSWFSYEELMELTQGFSRDNLLGEGGFGCVYKGYLPDGKPVAVKQLKAGSGQGEREFQAEVEIISRVHHRHLVSLVGYCIAEHHRLLVYEFVPNNTLEHHLHGKGVPVLDWSKRVKIAIGSARGLAYLHEDCHPRIIHRDIKSANILLDDAFEAQVADFGLAKLSNDTHTHVSTRVMGTFGYMAPEYASSGKLTDRSDVFSFGVVLLELITGRKPVDAAQPLGDESLVEWARPHLVHAMETGQYDELVDPRLEKNYTRGEMFKMVEAAAACVRHSAPKRPRMVQVVRALDFDDDDLSNGVKLGQSQVFDSGQYTADIEKFRRMAFGSSQYSGEYGFSGEHERRSTVNSGESESDTRALRYSRGFT